MLAMPGVETARMLWAALRSRALPAALLLLLPSAVAGHATAANAPQVAPAPDTIRDLRAVLDTGWIVQDRNGDDVVDFVDVRIVLPDAPSDAEVVAAANVAARLGYETSASDLGLAVVESELGAGPVTAPVVEAGGRTQIVQRAGLGAGTGVSGLAPGQGAVVRLPAGPSLPSGGVSLVGYDASGLLAAAAYLSGRYPEVWEPGEDRWRAVPEAIAAFLEDRSLVTGAVTLERIVVDGAEPGVAWADVTVAVADATAFGEAVDALRSRDGTEPGDSAAAAPDTVATPDTAAAPDEDTEPAPLSSLHFDDLHRLDVRIVAPDTARVVRIRPDRPWSTDAGDAWRPSGDPSFSLSELYSIDGLFRDTNRDLVPDETAAYLSVAATRASAAAPAPSALVDLATRIGLETAGARFPLATVAGQDDRPEAGGFPVMIGAGHYQLRRLLDEDALPDISPLPGAGFVRFVEGRLNGSNGLLVGGGDATGTAAALDWLAARAPYLWSHGKGEYRLADAETEARRFLQAREGPGQVALALHKLDTWMRRMGEAGTAPERVEVELTAEEAPPALESLAASIVRDRFPDAAVSADAFASGYGVGDTIFQRSLDIPWEVDEVRRTLEREVYPAVRAGEPAEVQVRVSEPPEIRAELQDEIRSELERRGAAPVRVEVLSAYKQGYSWLHDRVLPRLRGEPVGAIRIRYHTLEESDEIRWQTIAAETRWLQEIYPIDAVLARELNIPDSAVSFHATRRAEPVYSVEVTDPAGRVLLSDTFDPKYVVRPFFDRFPEYEKIRVTTGWLTATSAGDTLVDQRVETDPEAFWDVLQDDVYGRMIEYVMDIQDGRPSQSNAPYFDEFTVRLRLSEPDHRIGVDEEVISSLEALHEDIYFETLTLFDLIGDRYGVGGLSYPGRVLPFIDPTGAGQPGEATITLTGKERAGPELVVRSAAAGEEPRLQRYALGDLPVPDPPLHGVHVRSGEEGLRRLLFRVEARDSVDQYEQYRERTSEGSIDRTFLSVELLQGMLGMLGRLHGAGLFRDAVSWDRVAETAFLFEVEDDTTYRRVAVLPRSDAPLSTDNPTLLADGWEWEGERLVQWEAPIPPAENDSILAKLNTFPGVRTYYITRSFLGQPVWAADFLPPQEAAYVSQAKLNALKPTLFLSGRQHANEVSSTSHLLRLGELLATDTTYRALLDDVNVVLHPITNPDGARLAVEMQETNPDFMLHAGYLGALGVDATSGERSDDPIYPESQARRRIRETWLPDAYVNMHGYPSHEWVQHFAGYSAWVRSRQGGQRDWWLPRGWFIPGFGWVDDEDEPEYKEAQFAMLDSVAASITALPDVEAMNRRLYARYRKYGTQDRDDFREHFRNGVLVYMGLRGSQSIGSGVYSDRITYFSTTTEAPDETARGDWLELVASAGLAHSTALLRYLAEGEYDVEREAEAYDGVVTRKVFRVKPVLPPEDESGGGDRPLSQLDRQGARGADERGGAVVDGGGLGEVEGPVGQAVAEEDRGVPLAGARTATGSRRYPSRRRGAIRRWGASRSGRDRPDGPVGCPDIRVRPDRRGRRAPAPPEPVPRRLRAGARTRRSRHPRRTGRGDGHRIRRGRSGGDGGEGAQAKAPARMAWIAEMTSPVQPWRIR